MGAPPTLRVPDRPAGSDRRDEQQRWRRALALGLLLLVPLLLLALVRGCSAPLDGPPAVSRATPSLGPPPLNTAAAVASVPPACVSAGPSASTPPPAASPVPQGTPGESPRAGDPAPRGSGDPSTGPWPSSSPTPKTSPPPTAAPSNPGPTPSPDATFLISGDVLGILPGRLTVIQLTLTNPNPDALEVTSITVTADGGTRSGCPSSTNLQIVQSSVSVDNPLALPPGSSLTLTDAPLAPEIGLLNVPSVNQDACKGASFALHYTGTAQW